MHSLYIFPGLRTDNLLANLYNVTLDTDDPEISHKNKHQRRYAPSGSV